MFLQIIQWGIISLILIFLVHYLYSFFKDTLTIPKTRDLVNRPIDAYKEMYQVIHDTNTTGTVKTERTGGNSKQSTMKDELKNYLSNLSNSTPNNSTSNNPMFTNTNKPEPELDFAGSSSSQFGFAI